MLLIFLKNKIYSIRNVHRKFWIFGCFEFFHIFHGGFFIVYSENFKKITKNFFFQKKFKIWVTQNVFYFLFLHINNKLTIYIVVFFFKYVLFFSFFFCVVVCVCGFFVVFFVSKNKKHIYILLMKKKVKNMKTWDRNFW